ncbi:MAG: molybdopterin-dependent oxidoreductase [Anaerolineales bacterium]|nr:molybdopterin-dependent oxidoreductase [Anaerolineales bacterium]
MSKKISRRDFLKLASVGAATGAVLTGCGPASRYVVREPYTQMPEYTFNGQSTYFATSCRECSAGCGLVVRTYQGRAIKAEGNKSHPVNLGKTCARGQATLHGLYNPDRVTDPVSQSARGSRNFTDMDWEAAIGVVAGALADTDPSEIAFLMGLVPDHLFDLFSDLAASIGAPAPLRYGALSAFEARATLVRAAESMLGGSGLPFFDLAGADVTFSFGANFLETWLSPVAYTRGFSGMRKGERRGYLVHFGPRMSQTAAKADEWVPLRPGTEGLVALAIGRLAAEATLPTLPRAFVNVDVAAVAEASGVSEEKLAHLAGLFANAEHPLAIPGGAALGQSNGLETAEAVLALDASAGNFGQPGGVFLSPAAPNTDTYHRPANLQEMAAFVEKMKAGEVKVLFVHGVNPVFELPRALGFENAMKSVPLVISFATFPDETAMQADYIFPDHHGLESWGYQRIATGAGQSTLSGAQPVVVPYYNTRATADVLLAACAAAGGKLAAALPFADEVAFIQDKLLPLVGSPEANFNAGEINTFAAYFQQFGGWWANENALAAPPPNTLNNAMDVPAPEYEGEGEFMLLPYVSPVLGEAGANKPWLQEVPDPTTTVMWNTWVEINTEVAHELGIEDDDVVRLVSEAGAIEVSVYLYPAIRPDTIAIPFGQGHSAYGRYAEGRGVNPFDLLGSKFNKAGDLAFASMKVKIEKTGKKRILSRLESKIGVYGEGLEEH